MRLMRPAEKLIELLDRPLIQIIGCMCHNVIHLARDIAIGQVVSDQIGIPTIT